MGAGRVSGLSLSTAPTTNPNEPKGGHHPMNCEFMIASTPLPPCMPLPKAMLRLPVSNTAKVMYARLLDEILTRGTEDSNGILFIRFPVMEIAAALSRSPQTCKRSLNELEQAGMIMRVRQGIGEVSTILKVLFHRGDTKRLVAQVLTENQKEDMK